MKYNIKQTILIGILTLLIFPSLFAKFKQDSLPLDPSIRYDRLPNGFTYYIKNVPNSPEVMMSLYVKVGIHNETLNQMEFSHIIEHLAFTSANHFPISIKDSLKKLKIKNGGTTGDRRTTYNLNFSSNHMDTLKTGLQWFRDIANLEITKKKIDRERGNIRQEVIYKVGYRLESYFEEKKLFSKLFPLKPDNSCLFKQLQSFSSDSLIKFYHKWYRPDQMGLVVTGNIKDIDLLENQIIGKFEEIPVRRSSLPRNSDWQKYYLNSPNRFVTQKSDKWGKGKNSTRLHLLYRDKVLLNLKDNSNKGIQKNLIWLSLETMIRNRIREQQISETYFESPKPWYPMYQIIISDDDNTERHKLLEITKLIHKIKTYGFSLKEWTDTKHQLVKHIGDTTSASYWNNQIKNHFLYQEALPKNKREKSQKWLTNLSLGEINHYADQYLLTMPNDIGILARDRHKALSYTESEIRGWINDIFKSKLQPYEPPKKNITASIMPPQEISKLKKVDYQSDSIKKFGLEEILLANGVKVVLHHQKLSGQNEGHIQIHGFRPKGALCFPESDYFSAIHAPFIIENSGIGLVNGLKLQEYLSTTDLSFNTYINPLESGIKLNGSLKNLDKIMQLIFSSFSMPHHPDKESFKNWVNIERKKYLYPYMPPKSVDFKVAIAEELKDNSIVLLSGGRVRYEGLPKTNKEKAYQIYSQLFNNASDFTFIISGEFSKEKIMPLVQKYLGNLPNQIKNKKLMCNIDSKQQVGLSEGSKYKEFITNELGATYSMHGSLNYKLGFINKVSIPFNWKEDIKVKLLGMLINNRLKKFRYEMGASLYNIYGFSELNRYLGTISLNIFMECREQEFGWLRKECEKLIADIKKTGFEPDNFRIIQDVFYENRIKKELKPKEIYEHYRYYSPIINKKEQAQYIKNITMKDIQQTAKKYLIKKNRMEFILKDGVNP